MITPFFGFTHPPFTNASHSRRLYISPNYQETLVRLVQGIEAKQGVSVVIGEPGIGKTTLVHGLVEYLSNTTTLALVLHPPQRRSDFLRDILQDFGLMIASASIAHYLRELRSFLFKQHAQHGTTVLVIDEAQQLSVELLDVIRRLSALDIAGTSLLQIVLVGQPAFQRTLRAPGWRPLRQRIALRCALNPLSSARTRCYIAHRVTQAGGNIDAVFYPGALKLIHRWSGGIPSRINTFCDQALLTAYAAKRKPIDREIVRRVVHDLESRAGWGMGGMKRWLAPVLLLSLVVASMGAVMQQAGVDPAPVEGGRLHRSLQYLQQVLSPRVDALLALRVAPVDRLGKDQLGREIESQPQPESERLAPSDTRGAEPQPATPPNEANTRLGVTATREHLPVPAWDAATIPLTPALVAHGAERLPSGALEWQPSVRPDPAVETGRTVELRGEPLQTVLTRLEASQQKRLRRGLPVKGELAAPTNADRIPVEPVRFEPGRPIIGSQHDDVLQGSGGDDTLWAYAGKDHLIGGLGNDKLHGGDGDDVYEFAPGFGRDEISHDTEGMDTIVFAPGITPEQVWVLQDGTQLVLRIVERTDQITITGHLNTTSSAGQIERVRFADGTVWDLTGG